MLRLWVKAEFICVVKLFTQNKRLCVDAAALCYSGWEKLHLYHWVMPFSLPARSAMAERALGVCDCLTSFEYDLFWVIMSLRICMWCLAVLWLSILLLPISSAENEKQGCANVFLWEQTQHPKLCYRACALNDHPLPSLKLSFIVLNYINSTTILIRRLVRSLM